MKKNSEYSFNQAVWRSNITLPHFPSLQTNIKTDVLIIGGGITGILCAWILDRTGVRYTLVESEEICSGITQHTTAKITAQHGLIYHKLIQKFGLEKAKLYFEANHTALEQYFKLCKTIPCDFEEKDAIVYSLHNRKKIEQEKQALDKIGFSTDFMDKLPLPFPVAGAIKFKHQAQFHPLKFLSAIVQNLNIYEHTCVLKLKKGVAHTKHADITANHIIVATHFPFINKHGSYFLKMYQHRSYVIALEDAPNINGMYIDEAKQGLSFRNYKNFLLIGGGSHRTGKQGGNWEELHRFATRYYPNLNKKYYWATQDCMTLDGIPYIGLYSKNTPNLYVATGFQKWGMTSAMISAMILSDSIIGKKNPYAAIFSPSRTMLHPQLAINTFEAICNLMTISKKRCPHMGCALKWNPQEHSFDCPCHGSRFTDSGKQIDNPATKDLKIKIASLNK